MDTAAANSQLTAQQISNLHAKQPLELSGRYVRQQLLECKSPRRRAMLQEALADLEARIAAIP